MERQTALSTLSTGLRCRCPRCGEGRMFDGFLKLVDRCEVCGLSYDFADPADGPAFFVMTGVSFLVVAVWGFWAVMAQPPIWLQFVVMMPALMFGCLATLRPTKAWLVAEQSRITQGAQPFLLPLMMQVGFGMSAAVSGTITIASAIGSLMMKGLAPRILRRFGFRDSMAAAGLIGCLAYAACGFLRPSWPIPAIFLMLMAAAFFMSFQFTAYNTIAYDEIPPERMSSATSFYATFQQLTLSLGICAGAAALQAGMLVNGRERPAPPDFTLAFLLVTGISALATIWNLRFARDAGASMSGRSSSARNR